MQIAWTKLANWDIDQIYDYISEFNPSATRRIIAAIQASVTQLQTFPEIGRLGRVEGRPEIPVPKTDYTIVYRVIGRTVEILSVIHQVRQWPDDFG